MPDTKKLPWGLLCCPIHTAWPGGRLMSAHVRAAVMSVSIILWPIACAAFRLVIAMAVHLPEDTGQLSDCTATKTLWPCWRSSLTP